jgi:hypothetical protein
MQAAKAKVGRATATTQRFVRPSDKGTSLFIVLIETTIDGLAPSPVGQEVQATF